MRRGKAPAVVPAHWQKVLSVCFGILFAVVAARLVYIQVIKGPDYAARAKSAHSQTVAIHAKRGTIYDRNGNILATSVDCKTIYCNPQEIKDPDGVAAILAKEIGGETSDYTTSLTTDSQFAYVKKRVDTKTADKVAEDLKEAGYSGIYYLDDTKRIYPYGATAGQVLGFVGDDGQGLSGLEYYYNDLLGGTDGEMCVERGADGTPVAGGASQVTEAKDGQDIVISIDVNIQQMAEEKITQAVTDYDAESGSVVVTDPSSGEILAACSTPLLDNTDLSTVTADSMKLRLVSDCYEPGSVFKVLTMAIGINDGIVTPESTYTVPPKVKLGDDWVGDDDERDYTMDMSLTEILRRSSNTGTSLVAQTIGSKAFSEGVAEFGIGSKTGIDFPGEQDGIVANADGYNSATLGVMSFGQGVAVPMIQIVRAVGAVANDGTMTTPHFLVSKGGEKVDWSSKNEEVISKDSSDQVTEMMRVVIQEGTGTAAQVTGYDVAGKTGTGEQAGDDGTYEANKYVSSLIGFANADDPKVLVYVGLNGTPHLAASSAAPVFSAIMSEALNDMGVKPVS